MRLLVTFLLLTTVSGVSGFDLDSLLIQSVGGSEAYQRIVRMKSAYSEGDLLLNGTPGTFVSIQAPPDLTYSRLQLGSLVMTEGYDGQVGWTADLAGNPVIMSDVQTMESLRNAYIPSYSYLVEGWIPGGKEYRGIIQSYDQQLHEVAFYPLHQDTIIAHFDTETGRMTDYQVTLDDLAATITLGDYQQVDGVWMPFYSRLEAEGGTLAIEQRARVCEFDRELAPGQFSPPTTVYQAGFPEGQTSITAAIDYRAGHIKLQASVNGQKKGWFLLDTGAGATIIDAEFAADLNLPSAGSLPAKGATAYEQIEFVKIDSLLVGDLVLRDVKTGISDLEPLRIHGPGDVRFGGVIGYDFISQFPIMIDYGRQLLTIYNPDKFIAPDSGYPIPFQFYSRVPIVKGELLGIPTELLIDLGNPFGLILHRPFVEKNNLTRRLSDISEADKTFGGIGGSTQVRTAYVASFKMGDILLTSIRAILPEEGEGVVESEMLGGNVGNLILDNFRVLFDYKDQKMILYASEKPVESQNNTEATE
ncbi:MAG TPA: retropepsin-like aspartic protease [candidate division Zixibacteria bacterium]|nr:retropepsin-like aspartic protease [candidate division Zixibacteria bacterium]